MKRTVIFDISSYPYGLDFKVATNARERFKHAPAMYFACCYIVESKRYKYFRPEKAAGLIRLLKSATEVVTFYGTKLDIPVLRRHHGLKGPVPSSGRHTDLGIVVERKKGQWVTFADTVRVNLGEEKLDINKFPHDPVDRSHARRCCQSDVRQTLKLWKLHRARRLRCP